MKQYCLRIKSKNEKSLKNFLYFFFKHSKNQFNITQKWVALQTNRKVLTLLKSPHVNKTAQEHFESNLFTKKLLVKEVSLKDNLVFFKKIFNRLFHSVYISLEMATNKSLGTKNVLLILTPNNFYFFQNRPFRENYKRKRQKTILKKSVLKKNLLTKLLKILIRFSIFGETKTIEHVRKQNGWS